MGKSAPLPTSATTGGPKGSQVGDADRLREADGLEVARVDPEDGAGVLADGRLVVREPGSVRGADLPQARAGEREHLGDAEPAPDLDELAARHDHLGLPRAVRLGDHRGEREQRRPRAVVHDQGVFGARQLLEERHRVVVARAATPEGRSYSRFE
jgi:hypothetical protein